MHNVFNLLDSSTEMGYSVRSDWKPLLFETNRASPQAASP